MTVNIQLRNYLILALLVVGPLVGYRLPRLAIIRFCFIQREVVVRHITLIGVHVAGIIIAPATFGAGIKSLYLCFPAAWAFLQFHDIPSFDCYFTISVAVFQDIPGEGKTFSLLFAG